MSDTPEFHLNVVQRVEAFVKGNPFALFDKHSVAYAIGCHMKNASQALTILHGQGKLIIDHWIRVKGSPQPCYRTTHREGDDAKRPDAIPGNVKRKARRARPEVREVEAMKKRHVRHTLRLGMFGL